jgi:U2-associated protein SR140
MVIDCRFEARMASVFNHLHTIYTSFDGRIKADNFRRQIMAITSVWETWMVFNNSNVDAWIRTFLGRVDAEERTSEVPVEEVVEKPVEKKNKWKSVIETSGKEAEVVPISGLTNNPMTSPEAGDDEEDVDGEEMEEDVDGMPMEEDVDGEPMEDDDVDGEPIEDEDEDVDGVPMDEPQQSEESAPSIPRPHQSPEPPAEPPSNKEQPRPQKRQRMRAADMFTDS